MAKSYLIDEFTTILQKAKFKTPWARKLACFPQNCKIIVWDGKISVCTRLYWMLHWHFEAHNRRQPSGNHQYCNAKSTTWDEYSFIKVNDETAKPFGFMICKTQKAEGLKLKLKFVTQVICKYRERNSTFFQCRN